MTFAEMKAETELLYESMNSSTAPGFIDEEWGIILTRAQHALVDEILAVGVVRNSATMLAIEKLFRPAVYTTFGTDSYFRNSDGSLAQILSDVLDTSFIWILDEYVNTADKNNIRLRRITFDFYRVNLENPFRHPDEDDSFWVLQKDNIPVFITDGTTITSYNVLGVDNPNIYPIDATHDCVLNVGIHYKIVEQAVKLARMSVVDIQGYQAAIAEFGK